MTLAAGFDLRPDELLYSAIARHGDAMGYPRQRGVLAAAFGLGRGVAVADLPGRLDALVQQLPPGNAWTGADLAWRHTLLPYYAWCVPRERAGRALHTMCTADGRTLHERLGIRASVVPIPTHLRYCPACVAADRDAYGSAHWRRAHQPPGVYVCADHGVPLRASGARRTSVVSRLVYLSLERCVADDDRSALPTGGAEAWGPGAADAVRAIARDTAWLLAAESPPHALSPQPPDARAPGLARLWACCRRHLTAAGFVRPSGRLRLAELRTCFRARYGRPLLAALNCALHTSDAGDDWLARVVRRPRVAQHPLHHLLVLHLLGVSAADVSAADVFAAGGAGLDDDVGPTTAPPDCGADASAARVRGPARPAEVAAADTQRNAQPNSLPNAAPDAMPKPDASGRTRRRTPDRAWDRAWDRRLRALVRESAVSLREIGRRLGVTPRTVQRHARRLGVWRPAWRTWARSGPGNARDRAAAATRRRHRTTWQRLRRAHPAWSAAEIRRARPATFSYLYRYDRAWLAVHRPPPARPRAPRARVDWAARDAALRAWVERAVHDLLASDARPVRLCWTTIARRVGHPHLLASRRDRLPRTTAYLAAIVETRAAFAARKVWWAVERCALAAWVPARWAFVRAAGLRPQLADALGALIGRALIVLRLVVRGGGPDPRTAHPLATHALAGAGA